MQHLDHARPVKRKRCVPRAASPKLLECPPLRIRQRRRDEIAIVDACERPHPVPACVRAPGAYERKLHIRPGFDLFMDEVGILAIIHVVENRLALFVHCAQAAMVQIHRAVVSHHAHEAGAVRAEAIMKLGC